MGSLTRRWHPMGHPVEIDANYPDVLAVADALWHDYRPLAGTLPVKLKIEVSPGESSHDKVTIRHRESLLTIEQGRINSAIADLSSGCGVIRISRAAVKNPTWFAYHFLEPIAYVLLSARHFTMLHAACVAFDGSAVLLCGPSGAGKTTLAYACAKRGWSFVTGDAVHLLRRAPEPTIIGRPFSIRFRSSARDIFPELRRYRAVRRPNGKHDYEFDPRRLRLPVAVQARASMIVLLNRVSGASSSGDRPHFEVVGAEAAKAVLSESIVLGDARLRSEQMQTLDRLLQEPVIRLTYSEPFRAEELLRKVLASSVGRQRETDAEAGTAHSSVLHPQVAAVGEHGLPR